MPDLDGRVEDSDWEHLEDEVAELKKQIEEFADSIRVEVTGMTVDLPAGCIGRMKEKWRPLKRIAVAAGGHWPGIADELIQRGLDEDSAEREAGLQTEPPGMVMMRDLFTVWPAGEEFVPTDQLVSKLIAHNPEYWGLASSYGKALTARRLAQLVSQASKITSIRPGNRGPRGYSHVILAPVWHRLGVGRNQSGASGKSGAHGAEVPDAPRLPDAPLPYETPTSSGTERAAS